MKYLDDQLLGQHGGELLLNLPLTKRNSLAGIIIQRTNVSLELRLSRVLMALLFIHYTTNIEYYLYAGILR